MFPLKQSANDESQTIINRDRVTAWGGPTLPICQLGSAINRGCAGPRSLQENEVIGVAKNLNIPVVVIHQKVFANHPNPLDFSYFQASSYYTAEGYAEFAKAIVSGVTGEQKSRKTIIEDKQYS
jgi:hypothetical protein